MPKKAKALPSKESKPRGRNGGRPKTVSEEERKEQANVKLPAWVNKALKTLVPVASDRNALFTCWARAYVIDNGESDRLLAQSPLALELLTYLEATDAPEHLRDRLELLTVQRVSDEVKIADGTIKTKNGAYII